MLKVSYERETFFARVSFLKRDIVKKAKFLFNTRTKRFETKRLKHAARLRDYFDHSAKTINQAVSVKRKPWSGRISIPKNKQLDGIQTEGVKFCLTRNHSYIVFEAGLGKTPLSVAVMNSLTKSNDPILLIVPPFLISNWKRELEEWATQDYAVVLVRSKDEFAKFFEPPNLYHSSHIRKLIFIVPDSIIKEFEIADSLRANTFCLAIVDEAQRFLKDDTQRTQALYGDGFANGIVHKAENVVLLSGSPIRKGPIELFPAVNALASNLIGYRSLEEFGVRYCGGFMREIYKGKFAWDFSGSDREDELKEKLFDKFIKFEKFSDHIKVKSREQIIILDGVVPQSITDFEETVIKKRSIEEIIGSKNIGDIARYRKMLVKPMLPVAIDYVKYILESTDKSVIVFGYHQDMIEGLARGLKKYGCEMIYGKVKTKHRDEIERRFQDRQIRVIAAQVGSMVGLNFQAGTFGIFAESDYDYTTNYQALSRMVRRGQNKFVDISHLALTGTLHEFILRKAITKQKTIKKLFN